jgi:CPA2 family monovalent cation:H+ antiporter-2
MEIPILKDIIIIFALSIAVIFVFSRIHLPSIVGFLLTGVLVGPYGLRLIGAVHEVEILAEIGVVLLLFSIGIEFSLKNLSKARTAIFAGGSLQVVITGLVGFVIAWRVGYSVGSAVFFGFLLALSSTAIVLKLLQDRAEIVSPQGRTSLSVLIYQDMIIVPMILVTPLLAGGRGSLGVEMLSLAVKLVVVVLLLIAGYKWVVPFVLHQAAHTRSRELFILTVMVLCFGVAWVTHSLGLSLALGAFMAGLIISESPYSHHAVGYILPFKDLFTSLFFVSIGMLLNVIFLFDNLILVVLVALGVLIVKAVIAGFVAFVLGLPMRTTVLVALALCQIGEFSFILSKYGLEYDLISGNVYQLFLCVAVLTMVATPFIIGFSPRLADVVVRMPFPKWLMSGLYPVPDVEETKKENHLVVVGFGLTGRNVVRAARAGQIPYVIVEMNPQTVRQEQENGEPIFYGDATQESVLLHAGIRTATVLVLAIPDPAGTERVVELANRLNPGVHIIVRTRYLQEMQRLYELGADDVIPEEFETSVEIFTRVLIHYMLPRDEIEKMVTEIRAEGYQMFRSYSADALSDVELHIPNVEVCAVHVTEDSDFVGKEVSELDLQNRYHVKVIAVTREGRILEEPFSKHELQVDDIFYVLGQPDRLSDMFLQCRRGNANKS